MNVTKKINVNFSSLVGLKAELLRKQTEVREAKAHIETTQTTKLKRKSKQVKTDRKSSPEKLTDVEDINAHKKSKLVLEAKARLYTKLKKSKNNNENFLVDFTSKSDESEEEIVKEEEYDDKLVDPDDKWVEYEDCFGRTRKCLAKDLILMREKDELLKKEIMKKRIGQDESDTDKTTVTKEPEIDVMRRKWEEQTQKLAEKANIHYQDILFDEARAHGVGYYAFSQDEEERAKQQENLTNLRKDTEQKQKQIKELKDLKEKMEQNRLKAARIRQRIRAGLPAEPEEDLQDNSQNITPNCSNDIPDVNTTNNTSLAQENEKSQDDSPKDTTVHNAKVEEDKVRALEELIENKKIWREMSQEEWVYKCRRERNEEFAPTYNNVSSSTVKIQPNSNNTSDHMTKQLSSDKNEQNHLSIEQSVNVNTNIPLVTYPSEYYGVNDASIKTVTYSSDIKNQPRQSINNPLSKNINEEEIAAGLKYLREKYERSQNH
ncbi:hypothetical protein KPH14_010128 [Odynerus spinipes]|uniref:CCDC174 alpha/beta GRSR domain-containing protein n=1 Tax=Odynerus spinipes TaxID=1348599 RepID=A0AAD9VTG2_9HYME|nr:hypothetical protein KPH14_010128 [Odynerus spinipes]